MPAMKTEYSEDRDYLLRNPRFHNMVGRPYSLLQATTHQGLDAYNAGLLMCPVDPNRSSGYSKLIDCSIAVFEQYRARVLNEKKSQTMCSIHAAKALNRIWGLKQ
jgi:hypothetical protein